LFPAIHISYWFITASSELFYGISTQCGFASSRRAVNEKIFRPPILKSRKHSFFNSLKLLLSTWKRALRCNVSALRVLASGVLISRQKWSGNRRKNVINAYTLFLKMQELHWDKPKYTIEQKIPFIPTEQELDALIAGAGKKHAAFLRLLKETAMRAGEAIRLEWADIDFEKRTITLNKPEKRSNPPCGR